MGTLYVDTGGSVTNSGSTDTNAASLTGAAATAVTTVITLDGAPNLSGLITSGATQSSIYLGQATNANQKIFWITAFDNTLKTVTVNVAPTGIVSSSWAIGGRHVLTNASIEGTVRAGDTVIFNNTPASRTGSSWTFRNAGDSTSGFAKITGKSGVRPVLNTTNAATGVITLAMCWVENLEVTSGALGIMNAASGAVIYNVKISNCPNGGASSTGGNRFINCEVTGASSFGFSSTGTLNVTYIGCYIHDNTGDGIQITGLSSPTIINCIIDTNGGRGILYSSANVAPVALRLTLQGCTIYGNGDSGLEVTDADSVVIMINNIFQDNGNAAGEYNVEWVAGDADFTSSHFNNCYFKSSNNLLGLTPNSTEIITDPQFINAASGDFRIKVTSPCRATGTPGAFLGGSTGYMDMGAVQIRIPTLVGGSA